jgi:hypothetical protein
MTTSRYYTEVFYKRSGDSQASWHSTDHGTRQGAVASARQWAEQIGRENVLLFDRYPSAVDF